MRGTFGLMDSLTDLRCAAGPVRVDPDGPVERVHMGMWESAVRLDGSVCVCA